MQKHKEEKTKNMAGQMWQDWGQEIGFFYVNLKINFKIG